jgi:hypothetical protein
MQINQPGIYRGISDADYRSDPTPTPSLTQSLVKILIERSPQHAWEQSPRLNPQFEYDDDTKYDIGNVAHRLVLGRGKEIEVVDFADWRTKASQEARETAADAGKIAVLRHQFDQSADMAASGAQAARPPRGPRRLHRRRRRGHDRVAGRRHLVPLADRLAARRSADGRRFQDFGHVDGAARHRHARGGGGLARSGSVHRERARRSSIRPVPVAAAIVSSGRRRTSRTR